MKRTATFDIACNDPDNGLFNHGAGMIQYRFGGEYIEIEADNWEGYRFADGGSWIRLHRRKFQVVASKGWVGNWCWDSFTMTRAEAKRFLGMLRSSGRWRCTHGPTRWFNWFNGPEDAHHDAQIANDTIGDGYE